MTYAMHKMTQIGCEALVQDAIANCPVQANAKYISQNYAKNTKKWALWTRQHSLLLLQVNSTNLLESYHSELKAKTSRTHGLVGMSLLLLILLMLFFAVFHTIYTFALVSHVIGACHMILEVNERKEAIAKEVTINFHTKTISIANVRPEVLAEIHKFPFPIQKLIAQETHAISKRLEEEKEVPNLTDAECNCKFFN